MNAEVPYMMSVANLHKMLDAVQRAGAPDVFHLDFVKDLGFTSSNDRGVVKLFKYLGMLDGSGRPQTSYREFMNKEKAKQVLANQMRLAFDDLFKADRQAHTKTVDNLKGWFKTKTGAGDAVAQKMASTFKSLAQYADFNAPSHEGAIPDAPDEMKGHAKPIDQAKEIDRSASQTGGRGSFGLVYRFEIHLPDTQNVDTFRAIFKALREELM